MGLSLLLFCIVGAPARRVCRRRLRRIGWVVHRKLVRSDSVTAAPGDIEAVVRGLGWILQSDELRLRPHLDLLLSLLLLLLPLGDLICLAGRDDNLHLVQALALPELIQLIHVAQSTAAASSCGRVARRRRTLRSELLDHLLLLKGLLFRGGSDIY